MFPVNVFKSQTDEERRRRNHNWTFQTHSKDKCPGESLEVGVRVLAGRWKMIKVDLEPEGEKTKMDG